MRLLPFILRAFAVIVCIASPVLAEAQSDRSIAIHHRKYLRTTRQNDSRALALPPAENPRDPRTWVGDPAGRPYVYVPGMASGGGGN